MASLNILFIEDDINKAKRIIEFLEKLPEKPAVVHRSSYQSGLRGILEDRFDYLLLDMSLRVFERSTAERGAESLSFGGQEILQQMKRRGVTTPSIIITQYEAFGEGEERKSLDELKKIIKKDYPHQYKGFIYYNASLDSWKEELRKLLNSAL